MTMLGRVARAIAKEARDWVGAVIRCVPGRSGIVLRRAVLRLRLGRLGRALYSETGVIVEGHSNISSRTS